ncbi:MAG: DNA gyrase inhibitor YacG, partial [Xanthobacteraceae bacterium]
MSEHVDNPRIASCPICRKPVVEKFRPFCSKRCADVDLNRWLSG